VTPRALGHRLFELLSDYDLWLDEDVRKHDLLDELLRPYPASEMTSYPVSSAVNSPRSQGESLIERAPINSA
jgi:putative SOS response-associated peptidase YedK